jgi:hypothetical protein
MRCRVLLPGDSAGDAIPYKATLAKGRGAPGFICKEQDMTPRTGQRTLGWLLVAAGAALNAQSLIDWMRHSVA